MVVAISFSVKISCPSTDLILNRKPKSDNVLLMPLYSESDNDGLHRMPVTFEFDALRIVWIFRTVDNALIAIISIPLI